MEAVSVRAVEGVVIRIATVDDVADLAELRRTFTFEDPIDGETLRGDFEESFARIVSNGIESGQWIVWIAVEGSVIVSKCSLGRLRGIGGLVLDAVTAWALETDVELLVVWPSEASVAHYERRGLADRGEPLVWLYPSDPA